MIQGVARWLQPASASLDRVKLPLLGAKRRFPNGCSGLALSAWEEKS
jgi:hypothetical protein